MSGGGDNDEATAFDLTALMDVLSNIIFFLMASFGATVVAGIPASVPTISESAENDVARDEDKVTATIAVKTTGECAVTVANNDLLPEDLKPYAKSFAAVEGKIDGQKLTEHLWGIKEKFRGSKDVIIIPENDVTYETLVEVMDASRDRRMIVEGKTVFPEMFPAVVVTSLAVGDAK